MRRNKVKKENPPARLLGTMILLVLGLVVAYATLALGILFLVRRLVHLEDKSYTLLESIPRKSSVPNSVVLWLKTRIRYFPGSKEKSA